MWWTHTYGNSSSHMLNVCLLKEKRQSWLQPLMKWYWEEMVYEDIEDSSGWNAYVLLILSIGMSYYQGGCNTNHIQVSSAQTNRTKVLTWEKHISTIPELVDLGACSWLSWIALGTSFLESLRSLKIEFRVESYGIFREVTCAVFQSYGSAANFRSSATSWQCHGSAQQCCTYIGLNS
jgi:hypothetical protein